MEDESIPIDHPEGSSIIDANLSNSNIQEGGSNQFAPHIEQPYVQAPSDSQPASNLPLQISKGSTNKNIISPGVLTGSMNMGSINNSGPIDNQPAGSFSAKPPLNKNSQQQQSVSRLSQPKKSVPLNQEYRAPSNLSHKKSSAQLPASSSSKVILGSHQNSKASLKQLSQKSNSVNKIPPAAPQMKRDSSNANNESGVRKQ